MRSDGILFRSSQCYIWQRPESISQSVDRTGCANFHTIILILSGTDSRATYNRRVSPYTKLYLPIACRKPADNHYLYCISPIRVFGMVWSSASIVLHGRPLNNVPARPTRHMSGLDTATRQCEEPATVAAVAGRCQYTDTVRRRRK